MNIEAISTIASNVLPATALAAIILFALREFLEYRRRRSAAKRRLEAIRRLISRELEVNFYALSNLLQCLNSMQDWIDHGRRGNIEIWSTTVGRRRFKRFREDNDGGENPVPEFYSESISLHLLDIATIDKELLALSEIALDEISETIHVRDSLIEYITDPRLGEEWHIDGFPRYGLAQVAGAKQAMQNLYKNCTGRELVKGRVR